MLDLTNEFGSKLWLGGSKAGTGTNLMIKNGIGAVWPAAKSVQPDDTAAIRDFFHCRDPCDSVFDELRHS